MIYNLSMSLLGDSGPGRTVGDVQAQGGWGGRDGDGVRIKTVETGGWRVGTQSYCEKSGCVDNGMSKEESKCRKW